MKIKDKIQIFILSRDRPDYLRESLDSVLRSSEGLAKVIVSDNSIGDDVCKIINQHYRFIEYRRRNPPLASLDHFNLVLQEADCEYLVMFHDDDIMMEDYVKKMLEIMEINKNLAAAACDAFLIQGNKKSNNKIVQLSESLLLINTVDNFLTHYFNCIEKNAAPFSGYIYRTKLISGLYLDSKHGGKHSDVSFLADIVLRGPIIWLSHPAIYYRIHNANDSRGILISEHLSLLRYLGLKFKLDLKSNMVKDYKYFFWRNWLFLNIIKTPKLIFKKYVRVAIKFFLIHTIFLLFTSSAFWLKLHRKIFH